MKVLCWVIDISHHGTIKFALSIASFIVFINGLIHVNTIFWYNSCSITILKTRDKLSVENIKLLHYWINNYWEKFLWILNFKLIKQWKRTMVILLHCFVRSVYPELCHSAPHPVSHNNKPFDSPVQYIPWDTQPTILTGPMCYLIHIDGGVRATRPLES